MPIVVKDASGNDVELLTKEEQAEMVTGAVRSQLDKSNKKLADSVMREVADSVKKTLDEYETARAQAKPAEKTPEAGAANPTSLDENPTVRGLKKQLEDLTRQAEEARAMAQAERSKQRDVALRQQLADQLTKAGLDPKSVRIAVGHLVDSDKRVRYAEEGDSLTFRDADGGDVDLVTGLKSWVKSDEAKIFMPPRGASGSGDRSGGKPSATAPSADNKAALGSVLMRAIAGVDSSHQFPTE